MMETFRLRQFVIWLPLIVVLQYGLKQAFSPEPKYDWDAIPYMSAILRMDGIKNDEENHRIVYQSLKKEVPEKVYQELTTEPYHTYRIGVYSDPRSLKEQMPFYKIKPLFIFICWIFFKMGWPLFASTLIPSILAYYLTGWLIFGFMMKRFELVMALALTLVFTLLPSTQELSTMSTPDSLSAMFMIAGIMVVLKSENHWLISILFGLAMLTRPENMLFIVLLYALVLWYFRKDTSHRLLGISTILITLGIYFGITIWAHHPGWRMLFSHTFINKMVYPVSEPAYVNWTGFWGVWRQVYHIIATKHLIYFLFAGLVIFGLRPRLMVINARRYSLICILFSVVTGIHFIKFFLMPDIHDRFFYLTYLGLMVLTAEAVYLSRDKGGVASEK